MEMQPDASRQPHYWAKLESSVLTRVVNITSIRMAALDDFLGCAQVLSAKNVM